MLDAILIIAMAVLPTMYDENKKMNQEQPKQEQSKEVTNEKTPDRISE